LINSAKYNIRSNITKIVASDIIERKDNLFKVINVEPVTEKTWQIVAESLDTGEKYIEKRRISTSNLVVYDETNIKK